MTVRIARLSTNCIAPRGQEQAAGLVDDVARNRLPAALAARLGPSLDREAAVCRLRTLNVTVRIDAETLRRGGLADAWAGRVAQALHAALARPEDDGALLRRHETRAAYLAAMVAHVLDDGGGGTGWAFPELAALPGRPAAIAILDILLGAGPPLPELLATLARARLLDAALALLDEVGLERLLRALAGTVEGEDAPSVEQAVAIARALARDGTPPAQGEAASRRQALALWLAHAPTLAPRAVWQTIRLLRRMLVEPVPPRDRARADDAGMAPPWIGTLHAAFASGTPHEAATALEALRATTPGALPAPAALPGDARHLLSDCAGMLLLCDIVRRLHWPRAVRAAGHGPRVLQAVLAGAGMRLLRHDWQPGDEVDPAVALLAGMIEEVDRIGLARVFAGPPPALPDLAATDWPALLEEAADALALGFAARVRGFRKAGRTTVVRQFLRLRGRILITASALQIVLEPSPWSIALHISGADDRLDNVPWMGGRCVSFVLEGL
jgi:hypothetical protein